MDCINLKDRFGDRFKVKYEESYYAVRSKQTIEDPWRMILLCQYGHICPWGGSKLAACTKRSGRIANKLMALSFIELAQDGDDGTNVVFDAAHFDEVARIMKPRRRRRMSDAQKAAAAERLRQYQPAKGQSVLESARQGANSDRESISRSVPV